MLSKLESGSEPRTWWRYQPLVPVAMALSTGVALDRRWPAPAVFWLWSAAVLILLWSGVFGIALRSSRPERRVISQWAGSIILLFLVASIGSAWHHVYWHVYAPLDIGQWCNRESRLTRIRARLTEEVLVVRGRGRDSLRTMPLMTRSMCSIEVQAVEGRTGWSAAAGRAHLVVDGELTGVWAGQCVEIMGEVIAPSSVSNPGEFDYAAFLRGRRTRALVRCDEPQAVRPIEAAAAAGLSNWFQRVAGACERKLMSRLPSGQGEIAVALLLGRYELLDEDVTERYMCTGTMHILAISGQHLAVLAGFLWLVLRILPIPRKWGAVALGAIVTGYALLTGARPPVLRAAVLVCVLVGSIMLDVRSRRANSLALALIIVLSINPSDLFDRGLQLSFLAVAALFWIVRPVWGYFHGTPDPLDELKESTRPLAVRWMLALCRAGGFALVTSLLVWLANVPLLAARFHLVSPVAVPLTVISTPLATASLVAGLGMLLVDSWFPALGQVLAWVCGWGIRAMDWCVSLGSVRNLGYWYVPGPPDWWVTGFYIGVAAIVLFRPGLAARWRWAAAGMAWLGLGFTVAAVRPAPGGLECQVLSVGNGSAAVLRTPGGRTVLVDAGQISGPRVGSRLIAPALWELGVRHIDAVVISHGDVDHYNGLPHLIERFSIGEVFVPPHFAHLDQEGEKLVCNALGDRRIPIRLCVAGDRLRLDHGVTATVLHPPADFSGSDNEQSLVLLVEYEGERLLLLTGDIEGAGLRRLLGGASSQVDVLVAPHHGSRRANPPDLIAWCRPRYVLASQGRPRSGATLEVYRNAGIPVLSTNQCGAITVRWDQSGLHVRTIR